MSGDPRELSDAELADFGGASCDPLRRTHARLATILVFDAFRYGEVNRARESTGALGQGLQRGHRRASAGRAEPHARPVRRPGRWNEIERELADWASRIAGSPPIGHPRLHDDPRPRHAAR